jgi:hypothetical protein
LVNAASLNDVVDIVSFDIFAVPDTVPASTGGTFGGGITATTGTFSGNVGIGTSSPGSKLSVESGANANAIAVTGAGTGSQAISMANTGASTQIGINGSTAGAVFTGSLAYAQYMFTQYNGVATPTIQFAPNAVAAMTIIGGGKVLVGTTAALSFASAAPIQVLSSGIAGAFKNTTAGSQTISVYNTGNSGTRYLMWFESNASKTHVGSITSNGSATAYNTSSDYRLKENVVYDWDATTRLKQLKPARFNFIVDETNTPVDGFLAHEAQVVVPECVTGTKDEVDDNDVAVMQGIDQSKLVPLLVKTIQELEARITALEA